MDATEMDEVVNALDTSLSQIKWRLKFPAKRRLEMDVLALCTRMRPVVMVDYGGKMPELQERLCALLKLVQLISHIFKHLKVMVIEDMIYLVHMREFSEHIRSSLNSEVQLLFVDLELDPPEMITEAEKSPLGMQLMSILKLFSSSLPLDGIENVTSQSSELIDLSSCMHNSDITLPTLNGWLLGYPIVFLFSKQHITEAIHNLSDKPLHIFKISVSRNCATTKGSQLQELLSFSVPYDLSRSGAKEHWAEEFLARMEAKWERCKQAWTFLQIEVSRCHPQTIVL